MNDKKPRTPLSAGDGIAVGSLFVTIALAGSQLYSSHQGSRAQETQNYVQIAVGVLGQSAPRDKEGNVETFSKDQQVLRTWAVDLLNQNSKNNSIPEATRKALVEGGASLKPWFDSGTYYDERGDSFGIEKIEGKLYLRKDNSGAYSTYEELKRDFPEKTKGATD